MLKKTLSTFLAAFLAVTFIPLNLFSNKISPSQFYKVENRDVSLTFDFTKGLSLTSIYDKVNHFEYLSAPSPLFQYSINHGNNINSDTPASNGGITVDSKVLSADHKTLFIVCHENSINALSFSFKIETAAGSKAAIISTSVKNKGNVKIFLKLLVPNINKIVTPGYSDDPSRMLGMIPQEIGGVTTLSNGVTMGNAGDKLEELTQPLAQLPGAFNVMEVADIYDKNGHGGIFFADMDGNINNDIAPIQLMISKGKAEGHWAQFISAGQIKKLSRLAIGVHHQGDYHAALDFYVSAHAKGWKFPSTPAWYKEAGAIWSTNEEGSGGAYELWPARKDLNTQIKSFTELPKLYDQATAMGTNIFYLNDYWEGDGTPERYLIKGDYIARADLGGKPALIEGIKAIHKKGGKVIMYVEPFIISTTSKIGIKNGEGWAARDTAGNLWLPWGPNYVMVAPYKPWQDYIAAVTKRLIKEYDIDGIFLDSWGWRYNVSYRNLNSNTLYTAQQWNKGVHDLADKVLTSIRSVKPDAIVMSESGGGEMPLHENGGSSADFVWGSAANEGRIIASPVKYGMPQVNFFSNGKNLNQTIQVYAAGHQLALNYKWTNSSAFIKQLLDLRRKYKDAMIYGKQLYQPNTGTMLVGAYFYKGSTNNVITVANVDASTQTIHMQLKKEQANSTWTDALTGEKFIARNQTLQLTMPGSGSNNNGLRVLVKQ